MGALRAGEGARIRPNRGRRRRGTGNMTEVMIPTNPRAMATTKRTAKRRRKRNLKRRKRKRRRETLLMKRVRRNGKRLRKRRKRKRRRGKRNVVMTLHLTTMKRAPSLPRILRIP